MMRLVAGVQMGIIMGQFLFAGGQSDGCNVKSNGCMNDFTVATWGL